MFQGIGKGEKSLIISIFRTLVCHISYAYVFAVILGLGMFGIYGGLVAGEFTAGIFAFLFGVLTVKALIKYKEG